MMKLALPLAAIGLSLAALPTLALEPDYLCYITTSSGRTVDLSNLCKGKPAPVLSRASSPSGGGNMVSVGSAGGARFLVDRSSVDQGTFQMTRIASNGRRDVIKLNMSCAERQVSFNSFVTPGNEDEEGLTGAEAQWQSYGAGTVAQKAMAVACNAAGSPGY